MAILNSKSRMHVLFLPSSVGQPCVLHACILHSMPIVEEDIRIIRVDLVAPTCSFLGLPSISVHPIGPFAGMLIKWPQIRNAHAKSRSKYEQVGLLG